MNLSIKRLFTLRNSLLLSASFSQSTNNQQNNVQNSGPKIANYFKYSTEMIPHPQKVHKGGEDALFANENILVVADGVGGWADHGIDPGLYSKELCKHIGNLYQGSVLQYIKNPKQLIIQSHKMTKAIGSTTVCILTLDQDQLLMRATFVGDSGYAIFRKINDQYELVFKSQEQQKGFNFPYQIGSEGDNPETAISEQHQVQPEDLIIIGTDGLFDNISAQQIKIILEEDLKAKQTLDLKRLSALIAGYAYRLSLDQTYLSPFSKMAKQYGYFYQGGKSDDITVIIGQIQQRSN